MTLNADFSADRLVRRGLKVAHLRLLAALGEAGQISAAAARLPITQSAASRLLREVETLCGARLYVRGARGVTLTEAGEILTQSAARTLRELDRADREIGRIERGLPGLVRIGAVTGPAIESVLPVVLKSRALYPGTEVLLMVETSDVLVESLLADRLDFYVGRVPATAEMRQLQFQPLKAEGFCLAVRSGHPLSQLEAPSLADCLDYDWVLQPAGGLVRRAVEHLFLREGLPFPERVISTSSLLLSIGLVEGSDAISPFARSMVQFEQDRRPEPLLRILPLAPDLELSQFGLVRRNERPLTGVAKAFHDMIFAENR